MIWDQNLEVDYGLNYPIPLLRLFELSSRPNAMIPTDHLLSFEKLSKLEKETRPEIGHNGGFVIEEEKVV